MSAYTLKHQFTCNSIMSSINIECDDHLVCLPVEPAGYKMRHNWTYVMLSFVGESNIELQLKVKVTFH